MTQLINQVGQKASLNISATTSPDQNQVLDWLNEGLVTLKRMLPYDYFPNSQRAVQSVSYGDAITASNYSIDIPLSGAGTLIKEYMVTRSASVSAEETPCKLIDANTFMGIKSGVNVLKHKSNLYPIATIMDGKVYTLGDTASAYGSTLYYICASDALTATNATASENPIVDKLIVDYAVLQTKYSDEETQNWQGKLQEWYKSVMDFNFGTIKEVDE